MLSSYCSTAQITFLFIVFITLNSCTQLGRYYEKTLMQIRLDYEWLQVVSKYWTQFLCLLSCRKLPELLLNKWIKVRSYSVCAQEPKKMTKIKWAQYCWTPCMFQVIKCSCVFNSWLVQYSILTPVILHSKQTLELHIEIKVYTYTRRT